MTSTSTTIYSSKPATATTTVDMANNRVLFITTAKDGNGKLASIAQVSKVERGTRTTIIFGDFRRVLVRADSRCTDKNVQEQHRLVLVHEKALFTKPRRSTPTLKTRLMKWLLWGSQKQRPPQAADWI
jgi:hypothetical protein